MDEQFWNELFCLEKGIEKHEKDDKDIKLFFDKYIDKLVKGGNKQIFDLKYWSVFIDKKNEWIENIVKKYFIEGENNFENMLIQQISSNRKIKTINKVIKNFDKNLSLIGEMIVGNYFIFGEEPTNADICLFAVLIQFFEDPAILNIPQLAYFFRLKGSSNNVGSTSQVYNQKGKGKEIIPNEEDDIIEEVKEEKEIVENKGLIIEFEDDRINILFNFVQNMKRKLGFNEESDWQNSRESPWELNYEPEDFSQKRYIGPFQLETDELLGINKLIGYNKWSEIWSLIIGKNEYLKKKNGNLWKKIRKTFKGKLKPSEEDFNELTRKIIGKIYEFINVHFTLKLEFDYFGKISFNFLASYICNIGREYSIEDGDECYNKYIKKFKNQKKIFWSIMRETYIGPFEFKKAKNLKKDFLNNVETLCSEVIKIVNNTVEEINSEKINGNVRNAIIIAEEKETIKD
ncbi:unnamed protein product [Meloidogyne enterolobii]|uniref:Uncharacterized protein n=1 Tax=Meloidogyne enterolobii TaxID=390850 RepID=A0ACB0ZMM6_MELEN